MSHHESTGDPESADSFERAKEPAPTILGISEVVLSVADLPRMRDFYVETLGFDVQAEACHEEGPLPNDGEPTISFLRVSDMDTPLGRNDHPQLLALIDYKRHAFARPRFDGHERRRSTLNHLAFEIPPSTYDAHKERLESLGLEVTETRFVSMAARALFFEDPEGNQLELIAHEAR